MPGLLNLKTGTKSSGDVSSLTVTSWLRRYPSCPYHNVMKLNISDKMQPTNRNLTFPNLLNARDLGGWRTRTGQLTRWRSLLRTDDLYRLAPAGVQALLDYGVTTVIDLRWPADAHTHPNPFHATPGLVNHQQISLLGSSVEAWRATHPRSAKELFNCTTLDYAQTEVRAALQAIAVAPPGVVLFHCVSGKDRTGVIAALLLALVGVEPDAISADYGLTTENLREPYLAAYPDYQAETLERVRCPPEQITNMLAHLDGRYGGVVGYLDTIGLQADEVEQLTARLLPTDS